MIDIKQLRENPDLYRRDIKKRFKDSGMIDSALKFDLEWRKLKLEADNLRSERNKISEEINQAKKSGKKVEPLIKRAKEIPEKLAKTEEREKNIYENLMGELLKIPNLMHESVPTGKDDSENVTIKTWGKKIKYSFEPKSHVDLIRDLDLADIERAAKVSGARFYYLKNELVILNNAIMRFALDYLQKKDFTLVHPPYMMNRAAYSGAISLDQFEETLYKIENEDLYLIATAEHPLDEMHSGELLKKSSLPLVYAGISPCFRKEAGSHGKDTKGIFRVHQFDKVEQFTICEPNDSYKWMEKFLKNSEEFFQALEIPYRVVDVCSGDISKRDAKQYDIEAWMPVQNAYREVVTCDNCTDWVSMRSNIKFEDKGKRDFVHTVDCTLVANPRAIVAILENHQQKDGSVKIPKALWKYTGFKEIRKKEIKKKVLKGKKMKGRNK